jgi:hypothetical protein
MLSISTSCLGQRLSCVVTFKVHVSPGLGLRLMGLRRITLHLLLPSTSSSSSSETNMPRHGPIVGTKIPNVFVHCYRISDDRD